MSRDKTERSKPLPKAWRLSTNERKVLAAVQHDSRQSVGKVAAQTGLRQHSVRYVLKNLLEREIIRPYILTNPHAIGLTDYCVFFNYVGEEKQARQKIIATCLDSPRVAYFAELTGAYQYSVSLFCRSVFEVSDFFQQLNKLLPRSSFETSFALRMQFTQFLGKCYNPKAPPKIIDRTKVETEHEIDELDRKILGFYSKHAHLPLRKIADFTTASESTVRYRLELLERKKVIQSFAYLLDNNKIGVTSFRILIAAKDHHPTLRSTIYNLMARHPKCSAFVHCIGSWDYELNFDVENNSEIGPIIEEVKSRFAQNIRTAHTLNEINVHRGHHFPMEAGMASS